MIASVTFSQPERLHSFLTVINATTNTIVTSIAVGIAPFGVAVHPNGDFVYVANRGSNTVSVINTATNTVVNTIPVGNFPFGVAVHPAGTFVYVTNQHSDNVGVIRTATNTMITTVQVGDEPEGIAVHPTGSSVYVANVTSNTVSVINTATNMVTNTINVGLHPRAVGHFIGPGEEATLLPHIAGIFPRSGPAGTLVTITGENFGETPGIVTFDSTVAPVVPGRWSDTQIQVTVPSLQEGMYNVVVATSAESSDPVDFEVVEPTRSVLFLPGLGGSRLYECVPFPVLGQIEDQLWPPTRNEDIERLNPAEIASIYTRDIIDEALGFNIYKNFIEFMDQDFSGWFPQPFDWRFDVDTTINNGILIGTCIFDGIHIVQADLIQLLESLAPTPNNRVSIITHSFGALLAKRLVTHLRTAKPELARRIDRLIMVAAPQLGTPQALAGLLHGNTNGKLVVFDTSEAKFRQSASNMPSAYLLIPSSRYFNVGLLGDVIKFPKFPNLPVPGPLTCIAQHYGETIDNYTALKSFLLADPNEEPCGRQAPPESATNLPNVLHRDLLEAAESMHADLDRFLPSGDLPLYQIVGWGEQTLHQIEYHFDAVGIARLPIVVPRFNYTRAGDGTVVVPSTLDRSGAKTYYVDMPAATRFFQSDPQIRSNRKHASILELKPVQALIKNILTGKEDDPVNFVSRVQPSGLRSYLVRVGSPVELHAFDTHGFHTGPIVNPDPSSDLRLVETGILNSDYRRYGEVQDLSLTIEEGPYEISISGIAPGTATLSVQEFLDDAQVGKIEYRAIPVAQGSRIFFTFASLDDVRRLKLDTNGDGTVDYVLAPGGPPGDLDGDDDVDQNDMNILLRDRNKLVSQSVCGARCDLDGDGKITVLDARKLTLLCTRPRCATK